MTELRQANQASGWAAKDAAQNLRKLSEALPELELILQVNQDIQGGPRGGPRVSQGRGAVAGGLLSVQETQELFELLFHGDAPPPYMAETVDQSEHVSVTHRATHCVTNVTNES